MGAETAEELVVLTAAYLREEGNIDPLPPFLVMIRRRDDKVITWAIMNDHDVGTLLQAIVPHLDPPSFRLLRGRDETTAQRALSDQMNSRLRPH